MVIIKQTTDFDITGKGDALQWNSTNWITIPFLMGNGRKNDTKAKLLYSATGIYCLFSCADDVLTVTQQQDGLPLWEEDVVELFLQPDPSQTNYFEYELSPMNYELPLIVFNKAGNLNRWVPFQYPDDRRTRHAVTVRGGEALPGALVQGWTAEFFVPYPLISPLMIAPPVAGSKWKGNLYRIDYDYNNEETLWALYKNSGNFHEYNNFGFFHFE